MLVKAFVNMKVNLAMRKALLALLVSAISIAAFEAGGPVRRVQEELRKRNLFFGDVDGKMSPELIGAVRVYQSHKGFEPTGQIDEVTARSLGIEIENAGSHRLSARTDWPDVPVLKSDVARELLPAEQAELVKKAAANIDASPAPEIPAEAPNGPQNLEPKQVTEFVQNYLRDGESNDVALQTKYYTYPVDYFDHGPVAQEFVETDTRRYVARWPSRKYTLLSPVKFAAGPNDDATVVEFTILFSVRNKSHHAAGKTRNFWTIKPEGDGLKIVSIREQHVHE